MQLLKPFLPHRQEGREHTKKTETLKQGKHEQRSKIGTMVMVAQLCKFAKNY